MKSSCILKLKEFTRSHHEITKSFTQKYSPYIKKKNIASNNKAYKVPFRWYCQHCDLMLTSKIQTQQHFFGKKHQSVVRNRNCYNQKYFPKLKLNKNGSADKTKSFLFDGLQNPSKSFDENSVAGLCDSDYTIPPPAGRDNILETVIKSEKKTFYSSDLSIYRTPSGKYYCQLCNITVNSQAQFLQHSESRKHKQKIGRGSVKTRSAYECAEPILKEE